MTLYFALRGVIRPPHHLAGVAKSRSLFVATLSGPLTFSRAWQKSLLIRRDATPPFTSYQIRGFTFWLRGEGRLWKNSNRSLSKETMKKIVSHR
jgi:hypothetical protein